MKKIISTDKAPAAIGPYSQAIEVNNMVFTSGVIPVNPPTGEIPEGIEAQARQAIGNLVALLKESGVEAENVIKTTVFINKIALYNLTKISKSISVQSDIAIFRHLR